MLGRIGRTFILIVVAQSFIFLPANARDLPQGIRRTIGAIKKEGWESSLVSGNPNLGHWHWAPMVSFVQSSPSSPTGRQALHAPPVDFRSLRAKPVPFRSYLSAKDSRNDGRRSCGLGNGQASGFFSAGGRAAALDRRSADKRLTPQLIRSYQAPAVAQSEEETISRTSTSAVILNKAR